MEVAQRPFTAGEFFIDKLVESILEHPEGHEWSIQGLGMLRTYLAGPDLRLHIWDRRAGAEGASQMHTHPWHFDGYVVAGKVYNRRYVPASIWDSGAPFHRQRIFCGVGGGPEEEAPVDTVRLYVPETEAIFAGQMYQQDADEIHVSEPEDGTVTLIHRHFREDRDHAYVFWPEGEEWVTAEPRVATPEEVRAICDGALEVMRR